MADDQWQAVEKTPSASLDNEWCSINEAARRLSVTPTAIRNRIKRGTLETRPNGNFGKLVRVPVTVPLTVPPTVSETVRETGALEAELRDRIAELQARLASVDAERIDLRREMAAERAQVAQERAQLHGALVEAGNRLNALLDAQKAAQDRHGQEVAELQEEIERLRRPWWRRWRG